MWFILLLIPLAIYLWFKKQFSYFDKLGFPSVPGQIPMGSVTGVGVNEHMSEFLKRNYDHFKKQAPAFGVYFFARPTIVPTDLDLIKEILVKSFDSFHDHGFVVNEKVDPLSASIFFTKGQQWKDLRAKLSPTFTSGKMKMMFPLVLDKAARMIDYLNEKSDIVELKEVLSSYTTESIASVAFGLDADCQGNPSNSFREIGKEVFEPSGWKNIKDFIAVSSETISKLFGFSFNTKKTTDFFMGTVKSTLEYREKNKLSRNDFFQLAMNLLKDKEISFNELAANCFVFFLAGFETSSTASTFACYELALNQDIQGRLRDEIERVLEKFNGEITYDAIMEMKYLDMVFNETLRKWPGVDSQFRKCDKDFQIPNSKLVIEAGTLIMIPTVGLHHDEEYWEDPERFDPERFNEENVKKIHHYSYIPFSEGPRICIGLRFGTMQAKIGLVKLLSNFRLLPCTKTTIPMKLSPTAAFQKPINDMWLKLEKL